MTLLLIFEAYVLFRMYRNQQKINALIVRAINLIFKDTNLDKVDKIQRKVAFSKIFDKILK